MEVASPDLSVTLSQGGKAGSLTLASPLIVAAGFAAAGRWRGASGGLAGAGAVIGAVAGTRTYRGRGTPRMIEATAGVLVDTAYATLSPARLADRRTAPWDALDMPIFVQLRAGGAAEGRALAFALEEVPRIAAIELAPAVEAESPDENHPEPDVAELRATIEAMLDATTRPLIVKLNPAWTALPRLAQTAIRAGAAAICVGGALPALPPAGSGQAAPARAWGLCGPAIRPLVLRAVRAVAEAVRTPVIAGGGVTCGADALAYLAAGARAIQIGSALLADPRAVGRIHREIAAYVSGSGETTLAGAVGRSRRGG